MPATATTEALAQIAADALVVGLFAESPPAGPAAEFDKATGGLLSRLIEAKEITGKKCEVVTLLAPAGVKAGVVVVVGLGAKEELDRGVAYRAAGAAAKLLAGKERGRVAFYLANNWPADVAAAAVCGSLVGCVGQDLYRAKKSRYPFADVAWAGIAADIVNRGEILAAGR